MLAMLFGILFVVLGVTGSGLVFRSEIQQLSLPMLDEDYIDSQQLSLASIEAKLAGDFDSLRVKSVVLPLNPQGFYHFSVSYLDDDMQTASNLLVDPTNASYVYAENYQSTFDTVVYRIHSSFLYTNRGTWAVGLVGIGTLFLTIFGVCLWWKTRIRVKKSALIPVTKSMPQIISSLHKTTGIILFPILILVIVTGIMLVFRPWLISPFETQTRAFDLPNDVRTSECIVSPTLDDYVRQAEYQFLGALVTYIKIPKSKHRPVQVTLWQEGEVNSALGLTKVYLDSKCALPVSRINGLDLTLSATLTEVIVALHNGSYFSVAGRLGYVFVGVLCLGFGMSGLLLWWLRRRKTRYKIS